MKLQASITDNITDVLVKIIEFTHKRGEIITRNINNVNTFGYLPEDLAVDEFSELLNIAVNEHIKNKRLILCDSQNIKFGHAGSFEVTSVADDHAQGLLQTNKDKYLEMQINKLLENSLNQRVATQLLKQKQDVSAICEQNN